MTLTPQNLALQVAFIAAIIGDAVMALAGIAGMNNWVASAGVGDVTFLVGGFAALVGHVVLMVRGGAAPSAGPLLAAFVVSGLCYAVSGVGLDNYAFVISGLLVTGAALVGWFVPRSAMVAGTPKWQAVSGMLVISTLLTYVAAVQCDNPVLFIAAIFFTVCNIAQFAARKNG